MKQFLIYTNQRKDPGLKTTGQIHDYLREKGQAVRVRVDECTMTREEFSATGMEFVNDSYCPDIVLTLGGDGTVLRAAHDINQQGVPMVGVNLGTLGFLAEIDISEIREAIDRLISGDYEEEKRMMLQGEVTLSDGSAVKDFALNDIVITRRGVFQIIKLNIYVNGQFLNDFDADGVIVTTATGSTGYSLSAGGPVIEPKAKLIMITPICSHSLGQRSIVLAPEDVIEIEIPSGREGKPQTVEVNFDGSRSVPMSTGDRIKVCQADREMTFARLNQVSFLKILHKKMSQ